MATIYILSDFGKLTKRNETIVFVQKDETETILFPYKTEQLVVMGKVTITGDAMRMLSKYKIPVLFLSSNGRFNGILNYGESKNVFLRQKQYKIMDDEQQSLEIARSIVVGKIKNQISFVQRIKRKSSLTDYQFNDLERKIARIKITLDEAEKADNIDSLRGYEGLAAKKYFEVFGFNIIPEWAEFKKRSKNPPKSNVNAVLSLLYVMLMQRV